MKKYKLAYSKGIATEPVISKVSIETKALINILSGSITERGGELIVSIEGDDQQIRSAISSIRGERVEVQPIKKTLELDQNRCVDCGYCGTVCPTSAIIVHADGSIEILDEGCVGCGLCVTACPRRALSIKEA